MARHAGRDAARRRQQEMPGAAGGIEHRHRQQGIGRIVGFRLDPVEHRIEGAVEQRLYEAVGGVVAAGRLARVAFGLAGFGEGEAVAVGGQARGQFEQPLIDRAQFLGLHVAPVDRHETRRLSEPGEPVDRLHQLAVGEAGAFQIGDRSRFEQPAERRQTEAPLPARERREYDQ